MSVMYTPKFRLSFPRIFDPVTNKKGVAEYSFVMLFDTTEIAKSPSQQKLLDQLRNKIDAVGREEFGKKKWKNPLKRGEDKLDAEGERVPGYGDGVVYCQVKTQIQPGLVDQKLNPIIAKPDFKAGDYAHASYTLYAWTYRDVETGMSSYGVKVSPENIQKIADGEPFSSRRDPEDDFNALDVPEEAEALE